MEMWYKCKLDRELAVLIDDFFRTIRQCSCHCSSGCRNDIDMFSTLIESQIL